MRLLLLFLLSIGISACGNAPHPRTLLLNRDAAQLYKQQNYTASLDKAIEALRYDPYQSELHLNMGLAFEGLEQPEKALQSYRQAQELAQNPRAKFMALFNEAQLLGKAKKVDDALAIYQKALEILPTSKEVKTNIELLTQNQEGDGKDGEDGKDQDKKQDKDNKKDQDDKKKDPKDQDGKEGKPKEEKKYEKPSKYQPRKFEGKDLSESDVKKILGELRQQEQKIRAEFNRKDMKEQPRDKDW